MGSRSLKQCCLGTCEGYLELSAKTKTYFTTAVALWDADFYVKVDDDVHVNMGKNACCYLRTLHSFWTCSVKHKKFAYN